MAVDVDRDCADRAVFDLVVEPTLGKQLLELAATLGNLEPAVGDLLQPVVARELVRALARQEDMRTLVQQGARESDRGARGPKTRYRTRGGMPATICRINLVKGLGPALQIAEGETIELPEEVHAALDERTNPTWPTTWFVPRTTGTGAFRDVYSVMNAWGANHCSLSYGHIGADLIALASMLRIPVYMHNVPGEQVFRPAAWNAFGTAEPESADFRACANFGPLYGRA